MAEGTAAAGSTTLERPDAVVRIRDLGQGRRLVRVEPRRPDLYIHRAEWETSYPDALIETILDVKGPGYLCDEIMRDEDPSYVRRHLDLTVLAHVDPEELRGKRVLDFGCGAGASTVILSRLLPGSVLVGVELSEGNLRIAQARAAFYGLTNATFLRSPDGDRLPENLGTFHGVVLSAVYEHLLKHERARLMPMLWNLLEPGGALFLDETPARWFPIETHTTGLPFINYLPAALAAGLARTCSKRVDKRDSWETLCRNGIRGASVREVLHSLSVRPGEVEVLRPSRLGLSNGVDLWFQGYAAAATGRASSLKRGSLPVLKVASALLGSPVVPYLSIALRKTVRASSQDAASASPRRT